MNERRARRAAAIGFLCALVATATAARAAPAADETVLERIDALLDPLDRPDAPGCAVGVIRQGRFVYRRGVGMANLDDAVPVTVRTVFRIGSVSKQFTALAVLLAERKGLLSLDDDIRRYVPELPRYESPVTIRHLLHHTSGLRDYLVVMELKGFRDEDYYTDEDVLDALARLERLDFSPGEEYLYSNTGYFLLSQILLRATGTTLRRFAAREIFEPLGMGSSHFHDDFREIVPHRAVGYRPRKDGGYEIDTTRLEMVGDGGVFTSIEDLLAWHRNFDEPRVGDRALIDAMATPGVLADGTEQQYGLGLRRWRYRGLLAVGHGGSFVGYRAHSVRFPEADLALVTLCNLSSMRPGDLNRKIADILLEDRLEPLPEASVALDRAAVEALAGAYWNERTMGFADLVVENDALVLAVDGERLPLLPLDETRFRSADPWNDVALRFVGAGELEIRFPGQRPFVFRRVEPAAPSEAEIAGAVGAYRCRELDVAFRIARGEDGRLRLEMPRGRNEPLEAAHRDVFRWSAGTLALRRDGAGRIASFVLQAYGARNFVFERIDGAR